MFGGKKEKYLPGGPLHFLNCFFSWFLSSRLSCSASQDESHFHGHKFRETSPSDVTFQRNCTQPGLWDTLSYRVMISDIAVERIFGSLSTSSEVPPSSIMFFEICKKKKGNSHQNSDGSLALIAVCMFAPA